MNTQFLADGLCAQTDPDAFYPEKGGDVRAAKAVCRRCPVITACLEHALTEGEPHGVWGGRSEQERRKLRRDRGLPGVAQQRVKDNKASVRRLARKGMSKTQISKTLKISGTMVNRYLAETGATTGRAA